MLEPADPSPSAPAEPAALRLGEFTFEPATGLLRPLDPAAPTRRLAPQPAALLALLVEKRGALASRDEIRRALWPDVQVDFEASLHHCVRQVRAALDDRAGDPRYVATVPRRGYRLVCALADAPERDDAPPPGDEVAPPAASSAASPADTTPAPTGAVRSERSLSTPARARRRPRGTALWLGASAVAVAVAVLVPLLLGTGAPAAGTRIAILPFADPAMSDTTAAQVTRVSERLLAELTSTLGTRADVIGPRTTSPLRAQGLSLDAIAAAVAADYVINARFVGSFEAPEILVELIRSSDGRHVWVRYYQGFDDWHAIVTEIQAGVLSSLPSHAERP
ncbi:winged helix-turn-helix domain-containing protein [Haliangium sp.]|uniref:winged helix-turn-helix domain-containing protein n=1 Tax=Haliangium sp. TaxID=2663208 RepID=UPI003D118FAA